MAPNTPNKPVQGQTTQTQPQQPAAQPQGAHPLEQLCQKFGCPAPQPQHLQAFDAFAAKVQAGQTMGIDWQGLWGTLKPIILPILIKILTGTTP